jgi:OmpA-OmpF porin, OOP family
MKLSNASTFAVLAAGVLLTGFDTLAAEGAVENVSVRAVAHFDFNGVGIRPDDKAAILAEVGAMKNVTWQRVTTTGHTDSVGNARYNERLSARRAGAVKSYLVGKGLDRSMIDVVGKGEANPVADNDSSEGRAKNRRAEIEFQGIRTAAK